MGQNQRNVLIANPDNQKKSILINHLLHYDSSLRILDCPGNQQDLQDTLTRTPNIKVAFIHTQLSDGNAFDILKSFDTDSSIVFTSASKTGAFDAMKLKAVDYLLEPIAFDDVVDAMSRAELTGKNNTVSAQQRKKRFLVKIGDRMMYKGISDIAYLYAEGKVAYIVTKTDNRKYIIDHTLDELERNYLDPTDFFRINRKYLINIESVEEVRNYANSRLRVQLDPPSESDMIVSRDKVQSFKNWLNL